MKKYFPILFFAILVTLVHIPFFAQAAIIESLTPEDDAVGVSITPSFYRITFTVGDVTRGTGNITLYKASDDSVVETWDVSGDEILFSPASVSVFPTITLEPDTEYYLLIDATAFGGFAGIADETTWSFTTDAYDTPRAIDSLSPEDDATNVLLVPGNSTISFDGPIYIGTGNITLYKASDDSVVETWDVTDGGSVSLDGQGVSFSLSNPLELETSYYFTIDATAIVPFDGIADETTWNFTTVPAPTFDFERVNVNSNEEEAGDGLVGGLSMTPDGRFVAFHSSATNLVEDDSNDAYDVFVRDRTLGITERVNLADGGTEADPGGGNIAGTDPSISSDGRFVAFSSSVNNLVPDDTNNSSDVFVYDRDTDTIERVSVSGLDEEGNNGSEKPAISSDGRYVVFCSTASNLVGGDDNDHQDIFIYDRTLNTIELVAEYGPERFLYCGGRLSISSDARYTLFVEGGGDFIFYIFRYDHETDTVERVDVNSEEEVAEYGASSDGGAISPDGNYVAFVSESTNLTDDEVSGDGAVFVRDIDAGTTELIRDFASGGFLSISENGRYVTYTAYDEEQENTYTYRYDLLTDTELNVTEGTGIADGGASSFGPVISPDGSSIVFRSSNTDLVENDTNGTDDIFYTEIPIEEPEEPPAEEEEENSGGSSSRRRVFEQQTDSDMVKAILEQLILLLQQLIVQLIAEQQN